jgi:hypothetical protein
MFFLSALCVAIPLLVAWVIDQKWLAEERARMQVRS